MAPSNPNYRDLTVVIKKYIAIENFNKYAFVRCTSAYNKPHDDELSTRKHNVYYSGFTNGTLKDCSLYYNKEFFIIKLFFISY